MRTTEVKTMTLRISPALYEHLKVTANKENRSLNNYITTTLLKVSNYKEPNEATKKAIEKGREEYETKSLKEYSDVDVMFDDILAEYGE